MCASISRARRPATGKQGRVLGALATDPTFCPGPCVARRALQQVPELSFREIGRLNNSLHGVRVEPCVARDSDAVSSVGHADMLAFGYDGEAGFFQGADKTVGG